MSNNMRKTRDISSSVDILDGAPVIAGTRIPAARIAELVNQGYDEKGIKQQFGTTVTMKTLRGALYELTSLGIEHFTEHELNEPLPALA